MIGENIKLRKLKMSDAESIYENVKDMIVTQYTTIPHPYTMKHAEDFIKKNMRPKYEDTNFGIDLDGSIIGMIGLQNFDNNARNAEVGYWLGKKFWGKGYMKEALNLMLNHAFTELKLERISAIVMAPNLRSAKLLERVGFKHEGTLRKNIVKNKNHYDELRFGILKEEFDLLLGAEPSACGLTLAAARARIPL